MFFIITLLGLSFNIYAQTFTLLPKSSLEFKIPYTMGTHEGSSQKIGGSVTIGEQGEFSLPIKSLKTDDEKMNCHLYEALGLNYKNSSFPDEHVCEDNKLPASGNDAIVYPKISYSVTKSKILNATQDEFELELEGYWKIHGQKKNESFKIKLIKDQGRWRSQKSIKIHLSDFDIIVKNFLFISVEDTVSVKLSLFWSQS